MDDVVGKAWYELGAHDKQLDRDLKEAEGKIKGSGDTGAKAFDDSWRKSTDSVRANLTKVKTTLAAIGIAVGLTTVIGLFGNAVNAASDLNEEVSKSQVVFGQSATKIQAFGASADRTLGQAESQALAAAGGFGNMFRTIGLAEGAAADMSIQMVTLASDMASFNNQDPSDMLDRLRSGLAGEAEPLRQFGVLLSEARVQQEAYASGIAEQGVALTEAQKVQARYNLILKDTALQQGDFARTSTGLANSQRISAAVFENALADMGQALIPLVTELTQFAADVMPSVADAITTVLHVAGPFLGLLLDLAQRVIGLTGQLLPVLAAWLGVKLVMSLRALVAEGKLASLTFKSMLGPIGLLIAATEGLAATRNGIRDWLLEVTRGKQAATAIKALEDQLGDMGPPTEAFAEALYDAGIRSEDFARLVETAGGDAQEAFRMLARNNMDMNVAMTEASNRAAHDVLEGADAVSNGMGATYAEAWMKVVQATEEGGRNTVDAIDALDMAPSMRRQVDALIAEAKEVPGGLSVTLDNGQEVVATSAYQLAKILPDAIVDARLQAVVEAKKAPAEIADAILAGKAELDPIREMIKDIIAGAVSDGRTLATNAALLVNPNIAEALTSNSTQAKAAMLSEVVNPLLQSINTLAPGAFAGTEKVSPAMRRALDGNRGLVIDAMRDLVGDSSASLAELQVYAEVNGLDGIAAFIRGIRRKRQDAKDEADQVAGRVGEGLDVSGKAYGWGYGVGQSYNQGLNAWVPTITNTGKVINNAMANALGFAGSPMFTHSRQLGEGVAASYSRPIVSGLDRLVRDIRSRTRAIAGGLTGGPADIGSILAGLGGPQALLAAAGGGGFPVSSSSVTNQRTERHAHLHVEGREPVMETARDAIDLWERLGFLD